MLAGLRVPDSDYIRNVCRMHGSALALTSANASGAASTTHPEEFKSLWPMCSGIVDAGRVSGSRAGSTIVDLSKPGTFRILRPGSHAEETQNSLCNVFHLEEQTANC